MRNSGRTRAWLATRTCSSSAPRTKQQRELRGRIGHNLIGQSYHQSRFPFNRYSVSAIVDRAQWLMEMRHVFMVSTLRDNPPRPRPSQCLYADEVDIHLNRALLAKWVLRGLQRA
jgi:hypothetical protein